MTTARDPSAQTRALPPWVIAAVLLGILALASLYSSLTEKGRTLDVRAKNLWEVLTVSYAGKYSCFAAVIVDKLDM